MPKTIRELIKPIIQDLSKNQLLEKYLHGQAQNSNEVFDKLIWDSYPKTIFTSKNIVGITVSSATINYISGILDLKYVLIVLVCDTGIILRKLHQIKTLIE